MDMSPRGLRASHNSRACRMQRSGPDTLAYVRGQLRLSIRSYGRLQMIEDSKEIGMDIGHRRVGRWCVRTEYRCQDSQTQGDVQSPEGNRSFNIAPNMLEPDFNEVAATRKSADSSRDIALQCTASR
jgi:putative transposase